MSREKQEKKHVLYRTGIRQRLFLLFAALGILFIIVLWLFQIRLLGYFYQREKFENIEHVAADLARVLGDADFASRVESYARDDDVCICVYRITADAEGHAGKVAVKIANGEAAGDCVIHHLTDEQFSDIYEDTVAHGGTYDRRLELETDLGDDEGGFQIPGFHPKGKTSNAVHARLIEREGVTYLLLLDVQLTPVRAVTNTLELQFYRIAVAFMIGTVLVCFFASRMIARPLAAITEKAKGLAQGNYEPDFKGEGYREVQELADALNYAAAEIGATDRLQKELIANISHDLRTPLTMIKGYSEMMRDIPGENSPENVQAIIDETTRLSELVSDLLDLSKLQSGTRKPELTSFDLTATVRENMQRYDTLIRHEGYQIEFHAHEHVWVRADRTMILQVIYNLINNAVNYTGESKRVTVTQSAADGKVRLSVSDDGEGIPPDRIGDIWDRYYRVDKVHKRAVMGTGLGLSIVKSVLEAHHANYGVDSAVGVGSVFWFELPVEEPEAEE